MYQIVFTSEFIRNLSQATNAGARCTDPVEALTCAAPTTPACPSPRPSGLTHRVSGLALKLLGAH